MACGFHGEGRAEPTDAGGDAGQLGRPGEPSLRGEPLGNSSQGQSLPHTLAFAWPSGAKASPSGHCVCPAVLVATQPEAGHRDHLSSPHPGRTLAHFRAHTGRPAPIFAEPGTRVSIPPIKKKKKYTFLNTKVKTM